ncbi:MAG: hypothetical protein ACAI38_21915 [Myxococcota bacterium]|nr:hypothetical protein [Myxococcota bacterium]
MSVSALGVLPRIANAGPEPLDPKFFANAATQRRFPGAFALQEESLAFVKQSSRRTFADGDRLVALIRGDRALQKAVAEFPKLSAPERLSVMKRVFQLEVLASGRAAPDLVLDDSAARSAFFEFDPKKGGPGRVILNPAKLLASANPYDALLLLVHETRHAYQFQVAFAVNEGSSAAMREAWRSGFVAQRRIFDEAIPVSFCDFLTLNQEYEAFLFGNYVLETLTDGGVDTSKMGTFASQYVPGKGIKIDLERLAERVGPKNLLDAFNELEKEQYRGPAL